MQPLKTVYVSYDGQPSSISYLIASNSDSWKFVNLSSRMFIRENKVIMQKNHSLIVGLIRETLILL